MNKVKKIASALLSVVILLTVFIMPVSAAEAPQSITVKRTKIMESYIGDTNHFTAFSTTDGVIVYCMELTKNGATSGTHYTFLEKGDKGLLYIMKNGYPNKTITNTPEIDQYITQSAVWWYLDDVTGAGNLSESFQTTDKEAYVGIRNEIIKLVNGAKAASAPSTPSMNVTLNNSILSLTEDGKYYESNYVTVELSGVNQYQVEIDNSSASAVNENGEVKTTFNAGEMFKVRLDASKVSENTTLNVNVKATGATEEVATYAPDDNAFQKVVSAKIYTKNVNLEKSLTLNANGTPGETSEDNKVCTVENGKYYGNDGREVDEATYNEECSSLEIAVPDTLANSSIIAIIAGAILVIAGGSLIVYRYRTNKILK